MDIRVLRYFLAAADQQSISGAAQKLHVTQPTLSRQFMELEEELGHTLFVRSNRKLRLTPKGELFYERARSIVNLFDRTKEEIRAENELTGDIRIAAGETPALGSLARAIARLQQEAPKVRFHIVSGAEAQVKSELHSGLTDFGVFVGIADTIGYSSIKLRQKDVWGVLTRIDGPFAGKKQIEASDLADQPLMCSEQSFSRNEFDGWLNDLVSSLNIVGTFNLLGRHHQPNSLLRTRVAASASEARVRHRRRLGSLPPSESGCRTTDHPSQGRRILEANNLTYSR